MDFDDGFDSIIVVDGVPVIDRSKLDKLLAKISKEFSRKGAVIKQDDIFVPWDDNAGKSKGYAPSSSIAILFENSSMVALSLLTLEIQMRPPLRPAQ